MPLTSDFWLKQWMKRSSSAVAATTEQPSSSQSPDDAGGLYARKCPVQSSLIQRVPLWGNTTSVARERDPTA